MRIPPILNREQPPLTTTNKSSSAAMKTFSSVQSLSRVRLFVTPWTVAHQASLSITNSQSPLKLMSVASVMPSNHLILCRPLLLLPSTFPSIRVFFSESVLDHKKINNFVKQKENSWKDITKEIIYENFQNWWMSF